ncbi:MAG: hypothetical protein HY658_08165 [Actinobacteria bacterium]|nr:hypothetical protein [Actinomycetota bacterium]
MTEPQPALAVFVPGLMGAGILVSAGILLADGLRRLVPNRGLRRRIAWVRGVHGVVAAAARSAGQDVAPDDPYCRDFRPRWTYLGAGATLAVAGVLLAVAGAASFEDPSGILHDNPWPLWAGGTTGGLVLLGGVFLLALGAVHRRAPVPVRRLVANSILGKLVPPPEDIRERARRVIPAIMHGEGERT